MKKILMIVFAGVFGFPYLCDSYVSMEAKVEKTYNVTKGGNKNESRPDSVSMDYEQLTGTIVISSTAEKDKEVGIEIYKDGIKMYEDRDNIGKGGSLNYTMTEEESGEYDVYVTVDGTDSFIQTIVK